MFRLRGLIVMASAVFVVSMILLTCAQAQGGSTFANGYSYRHAVIIAHTKVPNSDQTDFPVLVSGTYPYLAAAGNGGSVQSANGYDIIFSSDAAGLNKLDHEIDSYDPVTGGVNFWVRVPVLSHTSDTVIYVFYGNSGVVTSQENKAGVWRNHYGAVYHFANSRFTTDSAGVNSLANYGATPAAGLIGGVGNVDGSSSYLSVPSALFGYPTSGSTTSYTISFETWFKTTTSGVILGQNTGGAMPGSSPSGLVPAVYVGTDGHVRASMFWHGSLTMQLVSPGTYNDGQWHHIVDLYNNGAETLYIDGQTVAATNSPQIGYAGTYNYFLGTGMSNTWPNTPGGWFYFKGSVDELRISSYVRSADWIATEYSNQNSPTSFYTVGPQAISNMAPRIDSITPNEGSSGMPITIRGAGFGQGQGTSTVTFNGVAATPTNWDDGTILVPVPTGATSGPVQVAVNGISSNTVAFSVYPAYPSSFQYRRAIVIDHTKVLNTDQTDFPVLVSGTYPYLANVANGGGARNAKGYDIVFASDAAGLNKLDHEIDTYDSVTGVLSAWVRVPTLSHTADPVIYIFYGNAGVTTSQENRAGVWRNGYAAVYHLGSGSAISAADSTANANNGLASKLTATSGAIGGAGSFDGSSSYISVPASNSYKPASTVTVEAWVNQSNCNSVSTRIGVDYRGNGTWSEPYWAYALRGWGDGCDTTWTVAVGGSRYDLLSPASNSTGTWNFEAGTYDGSVMRVYRNGAQAASTALTGSIGYGTSQGFSIGVHSQYTPGEFFTGKIDELRISTVARSSDWIATEYSNQYSPQSFYSFLPEATANATPRIDSLTPNAGAVGMLITIRGAGFGQGQGASTVTFNGVAATPTSWDDGTIVVPIPTGATSGPVQVTVSGVSSNVVAFSVYPAYPGSFQYRRAIVIDHTRVPNTDQTDFPILISGTYSYLATTNNGGGVRNSNGYDIIFASDAAGMNKLDHEIDSYDPSGKVSFWVRVPTLSHTTDTVIYMFYGNSGISASQENKTGVWNGYAAVWHLGGASASSADSTANGNIGTEYGTSVTTGMIGGAKSFTGTSSSYIDVGAGSSLNATTGVMVSAWVNPNAPGAYGGIFLKGTTSANGDYGMRYDSGRWVAAINNGSWAWISSSTALGSQTWVKLDMCWDGSQLYQYTDGRIDQRTSLSTQPSGNTQHANIGYSFLDSSGWKGSIDEVRVRTDGCRTADWIATEYNNESLPGTFYSVGLESTPTTSARIDSISPTTGSVGMPVVIRGAGFGATQGVSTVSFNGVAATPTSWDDASIRVSVPVGATTGPV